MNTLDLEPYRTTVADLEGKVTLADEALAAARRKVSDQKSKSRNEIRQRLNDGDSTGNSLMDILLQFMNFTDGEGIQNVLDFSKMLERSKGKLLLLTHSYKVESGMKIMFPRPGHMPEYRTEERFVVGRLSGAPLEIKKVAEAGPKQEVAFSLVLPFERYVFEKTWRETNERKAEDGPLTIEWSAHQSPSTISILGGLSGQEVFAVMQTIFGEEKTELQIVEPSDIIMPRPQALIEKLDYVEPAERQEGHG